MVFEGEHSTEVYRIALVFSESDLVDARGHFLGLKMTTLGAFLRSTLP